MLPLERGVPVIPDRVVRLTVEDPGDGGPLVAESGVGWCSTSSAVNGPLVAKSSRNVDFPKPEAPVVSNISPESTYPVTPCKMARRPPLIFSATVPYDEEVATWAQC
ncbi:hypothetical protein RHMOL_Rhmol05G0035000 [Rhododendron molle]|uniref:Uncharacterized protein n=1 Tax=Rhododendron molle TaxID=49168 RepID=A0ACC0NK97_RHOML|nr:hypothetical protein RHMOL_Rhmol05G0035000 [Rhododendron molle]